MIRVVFVLLGVLLVALAVPLMRRRVPPNGYGLRVPATLADEWVWYEANARCATGMLALGVLVAGMALLLPMVWALDSARLSFVLSGTVAVGALVNAVWGSVLAERLLRERRAAQAD